MHHQDLTEPKSPSSSEFCTFLKVAEQKNLELKGVTVLGLQLRDHTQTHQEWREQRTSNSKAQLIETMCTNIDNRSTTREEVENKIKQFRSELLHTVLAQTQT